MDRNNNIDYVVWSMNCWWFMAKLKYMNFIEKSNYINININIIMLINSLLKH